MRILSKLKSYIVPKGRQPRRILWGIYKGIIFDIDLSDSTQIYLGLWEQETYKYITEAAAKCDWAIDIGAENGELSIYLLLNSNAQTIYAVEPSELNIDMLLRNLKFNGLSENKRISVITKFVGSEKGDNSISLDSINVDGNMRGFIKIDVDGSEMDVLRSGNRLLSNYAIDILIETHSQKLEQECIEYLTTLGYKHNIIKNAFWRKILPDLRPIKHNRWFWATNE